MAQSESIGHALAATSHVDIGPDRPSAGIVVGVDGSAQSKHTLRWAIAEGVRRGVPCRVVKAWTPWTAEVVSPSAEHRDGHGDHASLHAALLAVVDDILTDIPASPPPAVQVCQGDPVRVLVDAARHAEMLVLGTPTHRGPRGWFGSVTSALLHRGVCPTVVVPPGADTCGRRWRVVVGVDGSNAAARALEWAFAEACRRDAEIVVLHSWYPPLAPPGAPSLAAPNDDRKKAAEQILAQALWQLGPSPDVSVVPRLVAGAADTELVHAARDADLLVVGSRGRGALAAAVVGSTSRGCVHRSPCAVAVIP